MYGDGLRPLAACRGEEDWKNALDPGDFNICLNQNWANACLKGGVCHDSCKALSSTILAEPSYNFWFNMQLVVYLGYWLFCLWVIVQEQDEKTHVLAALERGSIFRRENRGWRKWTNNLVIPLCLLVLTAIYTLCLWRDNITQYFLILPSNLELGRMMRGDGEFLGVLRALSWRTTSTLLIWYCEAFQGFAGNRASQLLLAYSGKNSTSLEAAVAQTAYFIYQCYRLYANHRRMFDFVDRDILFAGHLRVDAPKEAIWFWSMLPEIRDSGRSMTRREIDEHQHYEVYLPFLRQVDDTCPDLIHSLFNEDEAHLLADAIKEGDLIDKENDLMDGEEFKDPK